MRLNRGCKYSTMKRLGAFWSALVVFLVYLVAALSYSIAYTDSHSPDISALVHAGGDLCKECGGIYVYPGSSGYDGQFYYLLSKEPYNFNVLVNVASLPQMAYRHQRILYPLIVNLLSLGREWLIPYVMVAVNLAVVSALVLLSGKMIGSGHRPWLTSFYVIALPGIFLSVLLDLAEPLWALLVLAAFYFLMLRRHHYASLLLSLSLFAKETTLMIIPFVAGYFLLRRDFRAGLAYSLSLFPYMLWQMILYPSFRLVPLLLSLTKVRDYHRPLDLLGSFAASPQLAALPAILLQAVVVFTILLAIDAFRKRRTAVTVALLGLSLSFLSILFMNTWAEIFSSSRAVLPVSLMLFIYFLESGDRRAHIVLLPQALLSAGMFGFYLLKAAVLLAS